MKTTITSRTDIETYVNSTIEAAPGYPADYDVAAIVDELADGVTYGTSTTDDLEARDDYWTIVARHDRTQESPT